MKTYALNAAILLLGLGLAPSASAEDRPERETNCTDGIDNDGDTVFDCGDDDCKDDPACKPDGREEATEATCSDWIDNDGDGYVDCDDEGCTGGNLKACMGSWDLRAGKARPGSGVDDDALPELKAGGRLEDLIGKGDDKDGERTDELCSDGIDNDGDGKIDCDDFGCRFDPEVTVCRDNPGMRFSIVSHITQSYDIENDTMDTRFSTLQLRALGPIPFIQDSFFLVSMRAERTPRLTFAMFQMPLGKGHYLNINSGGGGLSTALIRSASKQLLIDQPYYLYNAFEQGNGAAIEVGGQLDDEGKFIYRAFAAGGSGRSNGNVGGRYFSFDNTNYTWTVGAQFGFNLIGYQSRWDNPRLYLEVPTALSLTAGVKYDQRAQERYPAANVNLSYRSGPFTASAETYIKREIEFGSWQVAYNVAAGFLVVPKHLLLAADFGQYIPGDMDHPPAVAETDIARQLDELQWRVGLHWYFFRNIGVISAIYSDRTLANKVEGAPDTHERTFKFVGQYQF